MKKAIIIFTRVPVPGQTKTRMMPYLDPVQCAELHWCFLEDIRKECRKIRADLFIFYTPENKEKRLRTLFGEEAFYFPQKGDGLGERMCDAFARIFEKKYDACVLIGTDIPEISRECFEKAFFMLDQRHSKSVDIVFGPTADGGYYLVGMRKFYKTVFEIRHYGHGKVLEDTIHVLKKQELRIGYVNQLQDMDTRADLQEYRHRMRKSRKLRRSRTGRYLMKTAKISIIIPVYNEEKTIGKLQEQLKPWREQCEILFVDGGSTDRTAELIDPVFTVLRSGKGRARQMNLGAEKSSGDILFFLHCDSELPADFLPEIRRVMNRHEAGCFGIAFHSANFFMLTCRIISNHRAKYRRIMFGDQGIFIDRDLFFHAGMFPELPIMEDYQFSLTLKKMGYRPGMAGRRIYTSDRRFPRGTIPRLKLMWQMNRLRKMYRNGVPAEEIACRYQDVR